MLHLDVMDGRFVPNITFGPLIVEALREVTRLPFDLHLMVVEPDQHINAFAAAVETINVHIEVSPHINRTVDSIRKLGCKAGVCLNPGTPLSAVEETLGEIDQVMVMTINPGWGGQKMIPYQLNKVKNLRERLDELGSSASLGIDGGVKTDNALACVRSGADVLVCGSSVFNKSSSVANNIAGLRFAISAG